LRSVIPVVNGDGRVGVEVLGEVWWESDFGFGWLEEGFEGKCGR
jgi:hypothetical protein